jgi:hypothetical protein
MLDELEQIHPRPRVGICLFFYRMLFLKQEVDVAISCIAITNDCLDVNFPTDILVSPSAELVVPCSMLQG